MFYSPLLTPAQVFSCEICKIFKNTYFDEHLRTTASGNFQVIARQSLKSVHFHEPIPCYWSLSILPENIRKTKVS